LYFDLSTYFNVQLWVSLSQLAQRKAKSKSEVTHCALLAYAVVVDSNDVINTFSQVTGHTQQPDGFGLVDVHDGVKMC